MNLPKKNRLKDSKIFKQVFGHGKKYVNPYFIMYFRKIKGQIEPQVGLVASKKVGSAVERNKAKRKISTAFYNNLKDFPSSSAIVVVLRTAIVETSQENVDKCLLEILEEIRK